MTDRRKAGTSSSVIPDRRSSHAPTPELISPNAPKPNPHNARTHPKRQLEAIILSIQRFGFLNPVLAARPEGLKQIAVLRVEHLSDAKWGSYRR